jgi:glutaredoxin
MKKPLVTIYSRPGCHLCGEAKNAIQSADCEDEFVLEEVDIEKDPALLERYRFDIPVVQIDGIMVFKYKVDAREFRRKLRRFKRT